MDLLNQEIVAAVNRVEIANIMLRATITTAQLNCEHKALATYDRDTRICLHCGMTENDYCGYSTLVNQTELGLPSVTFDQYCHLKQGLSISREHKGPLIRGEITIATLIMQKHWR